MSLATMLRSTCTIKRDAPTKGPSGGKVQNLTTIHADQACDIQPARSSVIFEYRQRQVRCTHSVFFAEDMSAKENDVVFIGTRQFNVVGYRQGGEGYGEWPSIIDVEELPQ